MPATGIPKHAARRHQEKCVYVLPVSGTLENAELLQDTWSNAESHHDSLRHLCVGLMVIRHRTLLLAYLHKSHPVQTFLLCEGREYGEISIPAPWIVAFSPS